MRIVLLKHIRSCCLGYLEKVEVNKELAHQLLYLVGYIMEQDQRIRSV